MWNAAPALLTTAQLAPLLKYSKLTLEDKRLKADGPPYVKMGNSRKARVVYRKSDVLEWLDKRTQPF